MDVKIIGNQYKCRLIHDIAQLAIIIVIQLNAGFGQSNEEVYECENSAYAAPELLVIGNKEYAGKEVDIWSM